MSITKFSPNQSTFPIWVKNRFITWLSLILKLVVVNAVNDDPGDVLMGRDEAVRNDGVVVQQLIAFRALKMMNLHLK